MNNIEEYAKKLVEGLLNIDSVSTHSYTLEDNVIMLDIVVPRDYMKYVIGKSGKNALAIRTLINAYAMLNKLGKVKTNFDAI